jgi:hypothetical protein
VRIRWLLAVLAAASIAAPALAQPAGTLKKIADARIVGFEDENYGAVAVIDRRIDAFAGDRMVLLGVGLRSGGAAVLSLAQEDFSFEPYFEAAR